MSRPLPRCRWARPLADGRWAGPLPTAPCRWAGSVVGGRWPVAGRWLGWWGGWARSRGLVGWLFPGRVTHLVRLGPFLPLKPRAAGPTPSRRPSELRPPRARLLLRNESDPRRSSENPVGVRANGPFARTPTASYRETTRERAA